MSRSFRNKAKETRRPGTSQCCADYWPSPLHKCSSDAELAPARLGLILPPPLSSRSPVTFRLAQLTLCHLTGRIITRGRPRHVTEWGQMVNGAGGGARVKEVRTSSPRLWSYLDVLDGEQDVGTVLRSLICPSDLSLTPSTHPGQTQQAPAFTHTGSCFDVRAGDSCLRRSLEGLFCKRNLKPSPQEDPRPTFSLWQTEAADRSPLGLRVHLLTVVVHPHGAAEKQWNLLLRERQNCSASSRKACFHSRF